MLTTDLQIGTGHLEIDRIDVDPHLCSLASESVDHWSQGDSRCIQFPPLNQPPQPGSDRRWSEDRRVTRNMLLEQRSSSMLSVSLQSDQRADGRKPKLPTRSEFDGKKVV